MADDDEALGDKKLELFLQELRVILPGTQVLAAFLVTVPFQSRYEKLPPGEQHVYLATFFTTMAALACFLLPSVYHRLAAPVREKRKFTGFCSRVVVAGFVPMTIAVVLTVQVVTSMVIGVGWAWLAAAVFAVVLAIGWWIVPLRRMHERANAKE